MPRTRAEPNAMKADGNPSSPTGAPPVIRYTMPRTRTMVPSVVMNGLTPSLAMITPFANPTAIPAATPATAPESKPNRTITIAETQPARSDGRADRKIETAADDYKRHPDGDNGHDRGLHENIGQVERRKKTVCHERCGETEHNERDQWYLTNKIKPLRQWRHD